jgi:ankyrin repeat protein
MCKRLIFSTILFAGLLTKAQEKPLPPAKPPNVPIKINDQREVASHRLRSVEPIRVATKHEIFDSIELELVVDASGAVVTVEVTRGPDEFEKAAIAEAESWNYKPFERDGKAVPAKFSEYIRLLPPEKIPSIHVPFPEIRDWNSLRMTLRRSGCFGTCPVYSVEISGDGSVFYSGKGYVLVTGEHRSQVSQDVVSQMVEAFHKADYFSLDNEYYYGVTDCPTYVTSISFDGQSKSVVDYVGEEVGMPYAAAELEMAIDRLAGTERWITGSAQTVSSMMAEHWNFKSPQSARILAGAAAHGSLDTVRELIAAGVRPEGPGDAALANAAARKDGDMARLLLEAGAGNHDLHQMDIALGNAAAAGDLALVRLLLARGANPQSHNEDGVTVLMRASESGIPSVVTEILKYRPNVNARDNDGRTSVYHATVDISSDEENEAKTGEVVRILAAAAADVNIPDKDGDRALHKNIDDDSAQALIAAGANVNSRNHHGATPLMETMSIQVTRLLIAAGADILARDDDGKTAIDHARLSGFTEKVGVLEAGLQGKKRTQD